MTPIDQPASAISSPPHDAPALQRGPVLRIVALLCSLLVTAVLLCSVVLGLTSMGGRGGAALAQASFTAKG